MKARENKEKAIKKLRRKKKGNQTKGSKSEKQEDMMVSDERKVRKVKRENKYNIK